MFRTSKTDRLPGSSPVKLRKGFTTKLQIHPGAIPLLPAMIIIQNQADHTIVPRENQLNPVTIPVLSDPILHLSVITTLQGAAAITTPAQEVQTTAGRRTAAVIFETGKI